MNEFFTATLYRQLENLVSTTMEAGVAYCPDALELSACRQLSQEAKPATFTVIAPNPAKKVVEDMDMFKTPMPDPLYPGLTSVGYELAHLLNQQIARISSAKWWPNQMAVHRYRAGGQGLGAHKDYSTDRVLIAIFTLHGAAVLQTLKADRTIQHGWLCEAGGLCLLRGPGLTGHPDDRPLHRVLPPAHDYREVAVYRQVPFALIQ